MRVAPSVCISGDSVTTTLAPSRINEIVYHGMVLDKQSTCSYRDKLP